MITRIKNTKRIMAMNMVKKLDETCNEKLINKILNSKELVAMKEGLEQENRYKHVESKFMK